MCMERLLALCCTRRWACSGHCPACPQVALTPWGNQRKKDMPKWILAICSGLNLLTSALTSIYQDVQLGSGFLSGRESQISLLFLHKKHETEKHVSWRADHLGSALSSVPHFPGKGRKAFCVSISLLVKWEGWIPWLKRAFLHIAWWF